MVGVWKRASTFEYYSAAEKQAIDISQELDESLRPCAELKKLDMKEYRHSDYINMKFQNKEMNLYWFV